MKQETLEIAGKATDNLNYQYNTNGFGGGASGYIVIVFAIACVVAMFIYMARREKEHKTDKKEHRETLNMLINSFLETNKNIVSEIKTISDRQDKLIMSFNSSIEGLYDVVGVQTKEIKKEINSEKQLSLKEFEKQYKMIAENCVFRIKDSLENRIEQNALFENKASICGLEGECMFEGSEIYSLVKKFQTEAREKVNCLNFNNEKLKNNLSKIIDKAVKQHTQELCYLFDVEQNYVKSALHRGLRNMGFKVINRINEINFEDLV